MPNQIVYPTFKEAQQLYAHYSTIQSISILYNNLLETIDSSFLSIMPEKKVHEIYNRIILNYYPNEICIKSSFIKQILIKEKKQVTIFELPIGSSRADLCKINGESIAYEIKTDLDDFSRLQKQITDYYKIFEKVFIICSEANVENIIKLIPQKCGIYCYKQNKQGKYKFALVRDAFHENEMCSNNQLEILRKSELCTYFSLDSSLYTRNDMINIILQAYSSEAINHAFKTLVKKRFEKQWTFLIHNKNDILEIDYQWFYKNQVEPSRIYK